MKSVKKVFSPEKSMVCPPKKTVLKTTHASRVSAKFSHLVFGLPEDALGSDLVIFVIFFKGSQTRLQFFGSLFLTIDLCLEKRHLGNYYDDKINGLLLKPSFKP